LSRASAIKLGLNITLQVSRIIYENKQLHTAINKEENTTASTGTTAKQPYSTEPSEDVDAFSALNINM
jgi:hypothetical protein